MSFFSHPIENESIPALSDGHKNPGKRNSSDESWKCDILGDKTQQPSWLSAGPGTCCSWLDSWISRRFGKCHVSFFPNKHKRCLYLSLKGYIWWAKIPFKHRAVAISQLLFPPNFHMSFENKVLYFFKNSRNFAMEKCHLDNHIFMPGT